MSDLLYSLADWIRQQDPGFTVEIHGGAGQIFGILYVQAGKVRSPKLKRRLHISVTLHANMVMHVAGNVWGESVLQSYDLCNPSSLDVFLTVIQPKQAIGV